MKYDNEFKGLNERIWITESRNVRSYGTSVLPCSPCFRVPALPVSGGCLPVGQVSIPAPWPGGYEKPPYRPTPAFGCVGQVSIPAPWPGPWPGGYGKPPYRPQRLRVARRNKKATKHKFSGRLHHWLPIVLVPNCPNNGHRLRWTERRLGFCVVIIGMVHNRLTL